MEATGPDVKRPRLNYDKPPRMQSQQHPPPISPAHANNPSILPAPSTYPGSLPPQGPPPSPFHDVPHDVRGVPVEHSAHSFVQQQQQQQQPPPQQSQHHSGHSTPREGRFQHELNYSRRGSASATPRSPDDHHFPPPPRSMSMGTANEVTPYPTAYPSDPPGHLIGYQAPDQHLNGNLHHGLPINAHPGEGPGMAAVPYADYGPPSMHPAAHGYGAAAYGGPLSAQAHLRGKKGNRAQQACDVCRTRKAKCDEGRPRCGFCDENDMPCNYQSVAPAKVDRTNQLIIDSVAATHEDIKSLRHEVRDEFSKRFERLERILAGDKENRLSPKSPKDDSDVKPTAGQLGSPGAAAAAAAAATTASGPGPGPPGTKSTTQSSPGKRDPNPTEASPSASFNTTVADGGANESLPTVAKQNSIAVEHNTAAQKLFRWPSIKRLLEKSRLRDAERDENFVMTYELNKGPLRLYGRGQGQDPPESTSRLHMGPASPATSSLSGPSDDTAEARSPASTPESVWGYGINPHVGDPKPEGSPGGLHVNNTLKLDPKTVDALLQSYLRHMHIMHPFLDEQHLTNVIKQFKRRYNPDSVSGHPNVDALRDASTPYTLPAKRKASEGQFWAVGMEPPSAPSPARPDHPLLERSPTTAMVLLVLALGKMCEHRENLPGPVPGSTKESSFYLGRSRSPSGAYFAQSPPDSVSMRHSPSSSGQSIVNASAPSPIAMLRQSHRSPRTSMGELSVQNRNIDVIPGLAYYAQATDILGNLNGSTSLIYIQCCILAGLCAGQLANSMESLSWIQNAARALCILLSVSDPSLQNERKVWKNSVRFAFHTTSQLENDILAEIDLPRAGLHLIESFPYPDGYVTENPQHSQGDHTTSYGEIMQFYSSQLHIRGILNQTQHTVYAPNRDPKSSLHRPTRDVLDEFINELRKKLPPMLNWHEEDPPAAQINHARLRGKWYGAQYIIHRPYLHFALELDENGGLDDYMHRHYGTPKSQSDTMGPPNTFNDELIETVLISAQTCIRAAQRSTTAFDGILDHRRLIVTNIFGTSHAQFGNMLVLSAVYASKHLKRFISDDPALRMDFLFRRTINMLKRLKPISATLGHDQYILECLRGVVMKDDEITPPSASFSSN